MRVLPFGRIPSYICQPPLIKLLASAEAAKQNEFAWQREGESMDNELEWAIGNNELIVVCCHPDCHMHRLKHWEEGLWIWAEKRESYWNYTHSYCKVHHLLLEKDIEEHLMERVA